MTALPLLGNRAIARWEAAWALSALGSWAFAIVLALAAAFEIAGSVHRSVRTELILESALVAAWPVLAPALVLIGLLGAGYALLESSLQLLTHRLLTERDAADARFVDSYVIPLARAVGAGLGTWLVLSLGDRTAVVVAGLTLPAIALVALRPLKRAERAVTIPSGALELIGELPLLAHLPTSAIENLALRAASETFEMGDAILHRGRANDRLYVLDAGAVESAAEQGPATRVEPGSCFGTSAILGDHGHHPTVTALTPVTAWTITRADFIRCLGGPAPRSALRRRPEAGD